MIGNLDSIEAKGEVSDAVRFFTREKNDHLFQEIEGEKDNSDAGRAG